MFSSKVTLLLGLSLHGSCLQVMTKHLPLRETSLTALFKILTTLSFQKHLVSLLPVFTTLGACSFLISLYLLSAPHPHTYTEMQASEEWGFCLLSVQLCPQGLNQ